jgi:hypothetical protein
MHLKLHMKRYGPLIRGFVGLEERKLLSQFQHTMAGAERE